jgi:hypothetical protein
MHSFQKPWICTRSYLSADGSPRNSLHLLSGWYLAMWHFCNWHFHLETYGGPLFASTDDAVALNGWLLAANVCGAPGSARCAFPSPPASRHTLTPAVDLWGACEGVGRALLPVPASAVDVWRAPPASCSKMVVANMLWASSRKTPNCTRSLPEPPSIQFAIRNRRGSKMSKDHTQSFVG